MFGIGGTELVLIVLFALVIFGPDKLPGIARSLGRTLGTFKRAQEDMERLIRAEMFVTEKEEKERKAQAGSDSDSASGDGASKSAASKAAEIWSSTGAPAVSEASDEGADLAADSPEKDEEGGEDVSPED